MRPVTGSGEVRQVSPDYRCWVRPVSPNLSFPGIQRRIVGCDMLRHAVTCFSCLFSAWSRLVSTISCRTWMWLEQELFDPRFHVRQKTMMERERKREREIMKRDSTCGDIWRLNSFIYTMDDMDEHRFSGHYLTLITFFIVFLGSCLDLFSLGRRGRSRGDAAVKGGLVVTVSTLRAFDSGMPGAQVGGRHASIIIDL